MMRSGNYRGGGAERSDLRVLIVDLNNFSLYPTVAVGYLTAALRASGVNVTVLSPLAHGIHGVLRDPPETAFRGLARRLNYAIAQAPGPMADQARRILGALREAIATRHYPRIGQIFARTTPEDYDVILVSTYLMYYPVCRDIGALCERAGVPLLIGGSYFAQPEVARSWLDIPGLQGLIGGEVELELPELVFCAAGGGDLSRFPGVWMPDGRGGPRPPLVELDQVPFPDYTDFPWEKYPNRIVPILTGRGCGWGVCTFCSDVTSSAGRTFRSRSIGNVLDEIQLQSQRHQTSSFVFTDLKLNSDLSVWDGIISTMGDTVDSPRWIGSVHVGSAQPNGLDYHSLAQAKASGAARLTTGLESGSQRVLDRWAKGARLETTSQFLRDAASVGISVRVTMVHGAPQETPDDVKATASFLEGHKDVIDRVSMNRLQLMIGPTLLRRLDDPASRYPSVKLGTRHPRIACVDHQMRNAHSASYARETQRLLQVIHQINRKPLPEDAGVFSGVM